jgi:hypothetical protein
MFHQIIALPTMNMSHSPTPYRSKNNFHTDIHIEGEYFRSKTTNQYFSFIDKNRKVEELSQFTADFRSLDQIIENHKYDPEKHKLVRLEFTKNKLYFVESYQAITIRNPDVTLMNVPLNELLSITPKFEPLPHE